MMLQNFFSSLLQPQVILWKYGRLEGRPFQRADSKRADL